MTDEHANFVHLPHIIIVPSYKESETTLIQTLSVLASHPLARHAYKVCLAMEERELGSLAKGESLKAKFHGKFRSITVTIHPGDIEGELSGKGSNVRWAARYMAERECLDRDPTPRLPLASRVLPERIPDAVVTVMDADTAFAGDYFLAVSAKYLLASPEKRQQIMFIPPLIFDRNQSDVPTVTRVTDIFWAAASVHFHFTFKQQVTHPIGIAALAAFIPPLAQSFQLRPIQFPSHSQYKSGSGMPAHKQSARTCTCSASRCLTLAAMCVPRPSSLVPPFHINSKSSRSMQKRFTRPQASATSSVTTEAMPAQWLGSYQTVPPDGRRRFVICGALWVSTTTFQTATRLHLSLAFADTGYVATRLVLGDVGISPERAFKDKLLRQEMRTIILGEMTGQSTASSRCHSVVGDAPVTFQGNSKLFASVHPLHQYPGFAVHDSEEEGEGTCHVGPRPSIVSSSESSTFTTSSGSTGPPSPIDSDSDSLASFSPAEARAPPSVPLALPIQNSKTIVPTSHQASPNARNKLRVWRIVLLLLRLYEAHLMISHLVILVVPLIIWPAVQYRLQLLMASKTSIYNLSGPETPPLDRMAPWSLARDQVLSSSIRLSQYLSLVGSIGSVVMCICYDLYHREMCLRWVESATERRNGSRTSTFATILYYLPSTLSRALSSPTQEESTMLLSKDERALMTEENDDDDIEASAADPKPPFNPMDLGIRPSPFSRRNLPWCLFDYIAIPAALFFGVAPLIYAQVCQIWTDRLVYRVSGKPQVSPASMSKEGETA